MSRATGRWRVWPPPGKYSKGLPPLQPNTIQLNIKHNTIHGYIWALVLECINMCSTLKIQVHTKGEHPAMIPGVHRFLPLSCVLHPFLFRKYQVLIFFFFYCSPSIILQFFSLISLLCIKIFIHYFHYYYYSKSY